MAVPWPENEAGGFTACSRWLSEERVIPPDHVTSDPKHPGRGASQRMLQNVRKNQTRNGLICCWHPSGMPGCLGNSNPVVSLYSTTGYQCPIGDPPALEVRLMRLLPSGMDRATEVGRARFLSPNIPLLDICWRDSSPQFPRRCRGRNLSGKTPETQCVGPKDHRPPVWGR